MPVLQVREMRILFLKCCCLRLQEIRMEMTPEKALDDTARNEASSKCWSTFWSDGMSEREGLEASFGDLSLS